MLLAKETMTEQRHHQGARNRKGRHDHVNRKICEYGKAEIRLREFLQGRELRLHVFQAGESSQVEDEVGADDGGDQQYN